MKNKALALFIVAFLALVNFTTAQTVYITENGKKYHSKVCSNAKTGKKGIELAEAKKQGYTACGVCKPEEKAEEPKKKPTPKK